MHCDKCFLFLSVTTTLLEVYWALQIVEPAYNNGLFSSEPIKHTSICQEQKKLMLSGHVTILKTVE